MTAPLDFLGLMRRVSAWIPRATASLAIERRLPVTLLGQTCNVISPEDLLVYRLVAGRPRDLADVEEVARTQRARGATVDWDYVDRWATDTEFGVEDRGRALRRARRISPWFSPGARPGSWPPPASSLVERAAPVARSGSSLLPGF